MYKHSVMGLVGKVAWFLLALTGILAGLEVLSVYNFWAPGSFGMEHRVVIGYVLGLAGVVSMLALFMHCYHCMSGNDKCCMPSR